MLWDEILACTARGKSVDKAVTELELLRVSRSLNSLVEELKRHREYVVPIPVRGPGQGLARGQPRQG
jgi:hypothetical protein